MNNYLVVIVGPTAIGKTLLGIKVAKHLNTEIISADSRQFFKEMTIGTAVPSLEELSSIKHHFIQHISVKEHSYSVGHFEKDAINDLETIFKKNNSAVLVGGSGLYVDAVINGLDYFPDLDPNIREQLNIKLEENGLANLSEMLKQSDPVAYNNIDIENPHRVIRALEITIGTGKPYSSFLNKPKPSRHFKTIKIGLTADRDVIYQRINQRVDEMMAQGLLAEVKSLIPYRNLNALNTVGYKELFAYFDKEITLEVAISEIKKNTRRFAKRQLTWFKKDNDITWFDYNSDLNMVLHYIESKIEN